MLLPLPGTVETPLPIQAGRRPALTVMLTTVLSVAVLLPMLAWMAAHQAWAESLVRLAGLIEASWTLYADVGLFQPWQLWTWILVGGPWWLGAMNLVLTVVLLAAIERRLGTVWPMAALVALLPAGALVHVLAGPSGQPIQVGAGALVTGIAGLAWGMLRPARLTLGLGWWLVVVVGWLPVGAIALPWLGCLWMAIDGAIHGVGALAADALTLCAGAGLGAALRRRIRWAATR